MEITEEVKEALKRIIEEVKEKRKGNCFNKYCVCNENIGGNDIDLIQTLYK